MFTFGFGSVPGDVLYVSLTILEAWVESYGAIKCTGDIDVAE